MNRLYSSISSCRHCRYYLPAGRRGGSCQKLNVSVKSHWNACSVSAPPFLPPWNGIGDIMVWQQKALEVQESAEVNAFREDVNSQESLQPLPMPLPMPLSVEASSNYS